MIDKNTIDKLRSLSIEDVAQRLGMKVVRHKALCPFHNDTHASLSFHTGRNSFHCFVCGAKGKGPIDLVMQCEKLSFVDACRWLADDNNISTIERQEWLKPKQPRPAQPIDLPHLEEIMARPMLTAAARHFLFDERRISASVVSRLGISSTDISLPTTGNFRGQWFNAPSLLLPYRSLDGRLMSVQARYLGSRDEAKAKGLPRFQFPAGSRCRVFNLPVLSTLQEGEELWLSEGVTDCLALMSWGKKAMAIPSATLLTDDDLALLQGRNLHMAPDNDEPGQRLFDQLKRHLPDIKRHQLPEGCKDVGEWWKLKN